VAAYDLVWLRLDDRAATTIPAHPASEDPRMRIIAGAPYTWSTSAPRRVENFVDLSHFAWVHDGTLGRRSEPVPPVPAVRREAGELRFEYDPPPIAPKATALFGFSAYRMPIPLTVDIGFELATGARRRLWMTASPVDARTCRSFWFIARDDDLDGDDDEYVAFQEVVLGEDEPVVCSQDPPELPLGPMEVSVRTDRVSIEYRRWLRELVDAASSSEPGAAVRARLEERAAIVASGQVASR
jgi:vanillate O-demethylase monooxygenase subunit